MNIVKALKLDKMATKSRRCVNVSRLFLKTHSTDIAFVVGSIGVVAGTVMACCATKRQTDIIENGHAKLEKVNERRDEMTDEEETRAIATVHGEVILETARNYAPAVAVYSLSMASIFWAHHKQKCQYIALASAYETLSQSYKQYRKRVREELGTEQDRHFLTGQKYIDESPDENVDEDGNIMPTNRPPILDEKNLSAYSRVFDENNPCFEKRYFERNNLFLAQAEQYFTDILRCRGYLWLNDVYHYIGFPDTQAGTAVGWIYDESENSLSDNYVSFNRQTVQVPDDETGELKKVILLDFNVDGPIIYRAKLAKI